jgi:NADPH:quinone reductase-like Zn-dependent oxidoreductase
MLSTRWGILNYVKLAYEYFRVPRFSPLNLTNDNKSLIAFNLSYLFHQVDLFNEALKSLREWVEEGRIKAPPLQTYPFEAVAEAHRALESGNTVGKLILKF